MAVGTTTPPDGAADRAEPESLRVLYQEICKSHATITDFRAKLLALLPLASGTGALLLLTREANTRYFGPIGLYGLAITSGLFIYELRGIQTCIGLRDHAAALEEALRIPTGHGQFRNRPRAAFGGFIGAEGASWTIYLAILVGWAYTAGLGFGWWRRVPAGWLALAYAVALAAKWLLPGGQVRPWRRAPGPTGPTPQMPRQ
jgi:hypothetical protein